jgi:hypothetical protein
MRRTSACSSRSRCATLQHRDSTAWEFQAMRIYQRLERAHLNDDKLDALVDVSLQRLAYVREHSGLAEKDSLYVDALNTLRSRVPDEASWAEVTYALAVLAPRPRVGVRSAGRRCVEVGEPHGTHLVRRSHRAFPGFVRGAKRCAQLKAQLEYPALRIEVGGCHGA